MKQSVNYIKDNVTQKFCEMAKLVISLY